MRGEERNDFVPGASTSGFPHGGGKTGRAIRDKDWSATLLGPIGGWPGNLRTAADMALDAKIPMVVLWGADAVLLYNDAYGRMIGDRHPAAFGGRAREVVSEVWEGVGPVFDCVMATGEAAGRGIADSTTP